MSSCLPSCLQPLRVKNVYTGDYVSVSCGKCYACLNSKVLRNKTLITEHSLCYEFCLFVTLTYDNNHLPVFSLSDNYDGNVYIYDVNTGEILDLVSENLVSQKHLDYLSANNRLPHGEFGYLRKNDIKKFLKLLRKRLYSNKLNRKTNSYKINEKISYYLVGEYGTRSFRPHYHLLLFFNEQKTLSSLLQLIPTTWPHGSVDTQLSEGDAAQYVAGYTSSNSSMPPFYKASVLSAFASHSIHFGQEFFKTEIKDYQEDEYSCLVSRSCVSNGKKCTFQCSLPNFARLYPQCPRFSLTDFGQNFRYYYSFLQAKKVVSDFNNISDLARRIHKDDLLEIFHGSTEAFIYRCLLVSSKVIRSYVPIFGSLSRFIVKAMQFYSYVDGRRLKEFYKNMEQECLPLEYLSLAYNSPCLGDSYYHSNLYFDKLNLHKSIYKNSFKHKSLNSALIFGL